MVTSLKVPMAPEIFPGPRLVALPKVGLRLRRGDAIGHTYKALVDTGCAFTLARMDVAETLGLDAAAVKSSQDRTRVSGVGLGEATAWGWQVDLLLGSGSLDQRLVLPGARVYFTEWPLAGYPVLLGHHDVFERLTLSVLNHGATPYFVLRHP